VPWASDIIIIDSTEEVTGSVPVVPVNMTILVTSALVTKHIFSLFC
jgi:hypothetical protein